MGLNKEAMLKFEEYLLSHYCRKLANIGTIEIQSRSVSKKSNVRIAFDSVYSRERRKPENNEALGKRSKLEPLEDPSKEADKLSQDDKELSGPVEGVVSSLATSHYYMKLTYLENLRMNLMSYQAHQSGGLTTTELNNLLITNHRKKTITRSLENLQKGGLKSVPSRLGKNYYHKYLQEVAEIKNEIETRSKTRERRLSTVSHQIGLPGPLVPDSEHLLRISAPETSNLLLEAQLAAAPAKLPIDPEPDQNGDLMNLEDVSDSPLELTRTDLDSTELQMFIVLLFKALQENNNTEQGKRMLSSFLLSDLIVEYQEQFKDITSLSDYESLNNVLAHLESNSASFRSRKYVDLSHLHRLLSILIDIEHRKTNPSERKKKILTQSRIDRLLFIWKKVKECRKISLIDLSNMITKELESNQSFKVDKKTIVNLVSTLEKLGTVVLTKFLIKIESEKIFDLVTVFNRGIVSDAFVALTDEDIAADPAIQNPTFKRNSPLPVSLGFLGAKEVQKKKPVETRPLLIDQKTSLIDQFLEERLQKETLDSADKQTVSKSRNLARVFKIMEFAECKVYLHRLRAHKNLMQLSEICVQHQIPHSVTSRFLQAKFEVGNSLHYAMTLLADPDSQSDPISATPVTKPSLLPIPASGSLLMKSEDETPRRTASPYNALKTWYLQDDKQLEEFEVGLRDERIALWKTSRASSQARLSADGVNFKVAEGLQTQVTQPAMLRPGNLENTIQRLSQTLARQGAVPVKAFMEKFKNRVAALEMLRLLELQGDAEVHKNIDLAGSLIYLQTSRTKR